MPPESSHPTMERLRGLVRHHRVCYETWPEMLMVNGQQVKVGFLLELIGVHGPDASHILPGCEHCQRTYADLRQIAEWIMPQEERASYYDVEPFDHALRQTPKRKFRQEVVLGMRILHRHGFDQPVDECERRCLREMQHKLAQLGVHEGEWRAEKGEGHANHTESH